MEVATQISAGLCLGLQAAAPDFTPLAVRVLTVSSTTASSSTGQCLPLGDMSRGALLTHLADAFAYIEAGIAAGGVLICCGDGESEVGSTAVAVAWLMAKESLRCDDAAGRIRSLRPSATLNANYEKQLRLWASWTEFPGMPSLPRMAQRLAWLT